MSIASNKPVLPKTERITKTGHSQNSNKEEASHQESLNATITHPIRVELPPEDYAVLARRAAQEGGSPEALVAQAVGNLLQ